jgi:retinol-binding protein 3
MRHTGRVLAAAALVVAASVASSAQTGEPPLGPQTREAVVKDLAKALRDRYVFPDVGARAAQKIERQGAAGAYASLGRPELGEALTRDLQEVAHDKHLRVGARPPRPGGAVPSREQREAEQRRRMAHDNFGVQKVEILPGNVGYVDLRFFPPASAGGATAIAAMNLVGNADAVIVDLRQNGGGDPTQIQLISSYFFAEPTHLNSLYWREGDRTQQFWTLGYVPGPRMAETPVFVLTSHTTFSGGEEFANNLKMLKRGTIVGETTGGGANPGEGIDLPGEMSAFIPTGRAVNPVSGGNWEGTGVEPDVNVGAEDALKVAYGAALEKVAARATRPEDKAQAEWYLAANRAQLQPVTLDAAALGPFAGRYGSRSVTLEGATLFYQREGRPRRRLTPLTKDTFAVEDVPEFRVRFVSEGGAPATKLVGLYDDGQTDEDARTP